jgi:hypothetical protein
MVQLPVPKSRDTFPPHFAHFFLAFQISFEKAQSYGRIVHIYTHMSASVVTCLIGVPPLTVILALILRRAFPPIVILYKSVLDSTSLCALLLINKSP